MINFSKFPNAPVMIRYVGEEILGQGNLESLDLNNLNTSQRRIVLARRRHLKKDLARLTKVDLKEVWEHEAYDFTKWLSQPENLDLLVMRSGLK